uniref:UV-stimulated scaffold protein A n=1 Tax=Heterorhabditis bacteriophora TaxID=37862 RepID=A0A1I7XJ55_HETBA
MAVKVNLVIYDMVVYASIANELLNLVCETDPLHSPLPSSSDGGKELKAYAIKTIKQWNEKFAVGYIKLQSVAEFLRISKSIDYESATAELLAEKKRKDDEIKRRAEKAEKMVENIRKKYYDMKLDIERSINEVQNGLQILVPIFGVDDRDDKSLTNEELNLQKSVVDLDRNALHGYSKGDVITVILNSVIPNVILNEDNRIVAENVRDARIMLGVYKKNIVSWLRKLSGVTTTHSTVKELIDLKYKLEDYIQKVDELHLVLSKAESGNSDESSEAESDLEDVPEKEEEIFVAPDHIPAHIMERIRNIEDMEKPCCSKSSTQDSQSTRTMEKHYIPVVSFDIDLKYWGEKRGPVEVLKNNTDDHRFWRPQDEESISHRDTIDCRVFPFTGTERKSDKQCRARLPSGKLCPRKDLEKCPLHGAIVERNEHGFPTNSCEAKTKEHTSTTREDEEYLRDLETATGQNFQIGTKRHQHKFHHEETSIRKRLEKKLLNKRAIKRVSEVLDTVRKAKIQKKFGGQFAHSLSR